MKPRMSVVKLSMGIIFLFFTYMNGNIHAENIDPENIDAQYAYGETVGWLNGEPSGNGGPGVTVEDVTLTGYIWGENIGWVSLSCKNTDSCSTVDYGVTNDGNGNLSGFAWSENTGWISFSCENTGTCGTLDYGVTITPDTGKFSGHAWDENIGWISFQFAELTPFEITTSWNVFIADCEGDFDDNHKVSHSDLVYMTPYIGRTGCYVEASCEGDFDFDGDVDGSDIMLFAEDFGRIDCP